MSENGQTPLETVLCGRCATLCDPEDNFCRHCALPLTEQQLPSVRDGRALPAVRQPALPAAVVRGAAIVAAGTLAELLVRRLVRGALHRGASVVHLPARRAKKEVIAEPAPDGAQVITDTLLLRRIRIRR